MSIIEKKKGIFSTIGALTSLRNEGSNTNLTNSVKSINTKANDSMAFLLDILKTVVGGEVLKILVGNLLTDFLDKIELKMKPVITKQFIQSNSEVELPNAFKNGISFNIKKIDAYGKFKIKANSISNDLKFGVVPDFDNKLSEAIRNNGTEILYNGMKIKFEQATQLVTIKPEIGNLKIGEWFSNYVEGMKFYNKKEVVSNVLDAIFGTLSKSEGKSVNQILEELRIQHEVDNIVNNGTALFDLTKNTDLANNIKNGRTEYNMGCGYVYSELSEATISSVANAICLIDADANTASDALLECINPDNNEVIDTNIDSIKDNFFTRIINLIKEKVINAMILSPQILALKIIFDAITTGEDETVNIVNKVKDSRQFIKCIADMFVSMLCEYIFILVIAELRNLVLPIAEKIIKEKVNQTKRIIRSLIPVKFKL